jgi:predicted nucleotidyltransferase
MEIPVLPRLILCDDLIRLRSGEILSVVGNFVGPMLRGRIAYLPDNEGDREIAGRRYTKATYETGHLLICGHRVLNLPGEQHFLVPRERVAAWYPAYGAFEYVPPEYQAECTDLIARLARDCDIAPEDNGLTGSGALRSIRLESDFDWVVYQRDPSRLRQYVTSRPDIFVPELTFSLAHIARKYDILRGITIPHRLRLFSERWKYYRYGSLRISVSFVDPAETVDHLLNPRTLHGDVRMTAQVIDGPSSYHMPFRIPVVAESGFYQLLTWQFLYNGAFEAGDIVEVSGEECMVGGEKYVLVERPSHFIRKPLH